MSTIAYLRFSTDHQDERQQLNTITKYAEAKGMRIDKTYSDEGVSGGTSYTQRNLFDLCNNIQEGDIVIISEISRLTRSGIGELSEIIKNYFKPNKLRLIICNVGLDVDCTDINPMIEMQLMMMATFAKIEKQLIQDRVRSAHEVRKNAIKEQGYFINRHGEKITSYASAYGKNTGGTHKRSCTIAGKVSAEKRKQKALSNEHNIKFVDALQLFEESNGRIGANTDITPFVRMLNKLKLKTSTGLEFNNARAKAMLTSMRNIFDLYAS